MATAAHVSAPPSAHRLDRFPQVIAKTRLSRSQIYRLVRDGRFPQPVRLGPASVAFVASEVDAWVEARIAERDANVTSSAA